MLEKLILRRVVVRLLKRLGDTDFIRNDVTPDELDRLRDTGLAFGDALAAVTAPTWDEKVLERLRSWFGPDDPKNRPGALLKHLRAWLDDSEEEAGGQG